MVRAVLVFKHISLGLVFKTLAQDVLGISYRAALSCFRKLLAHKGIEAHAAGAEERVAVDDAIVEVAHIERVDDVERLAQIHGQQQVTRKPVARSARHDAQGCIGVYNGAGHLVHGAVATHGHNKVHAVVLGA